MFVSLGGTGEVGTAFDVGDVGLVPSAEASSPPGTVGAEVSDTGASEVDVAGVDGAGAGATGSVGFVVTVVVADFVSFSFVTVTVSGFSFRVSVSVTVLVTECTVVTALLALRPVRDAAIR